MVAEQLKKLLKNTKVTSLIPRKDKVYPSTALHSAEESLSPTPGSYLLTVGHPG